MSDPQYILITPAKNEAVYIEKTIQSVISQTIKPVKWIIVSDGSTDQTDNIVERYLDKNPFMQLVRLERNKERNFASKVHAIRKGFENVRGVDYEYYGNLDADISFQPDYYEKILTEFSKNPALGIAGGIVLEKLGNAKFHPQIVSEEFSVAGAVQMFRRDCYEEIGGYIPLEKGGVDAIAETMARMHGWEVRSFQSIKVVHHKQTGTKKANILKAKYLLGIAEYSHGNHPLFQILKCLYRAKEKPMIVGSISRLAGYSVAFMREDKITVPDEVVRYLRKEQLQRLWLPFSNLKRQREGIKY